MDIRAMQICYMEAAEYTEVAQRILFCHAPQNGSTQRVACGHLLPKTPYAIGIAAIYPLRKLCASVDSV